MRSRRRIDLALTQVEMLVILVQGLTADEEEAPERDLGAEIYTLRFWGVNFRLYTFVVVESKESPGTTVQYMGSDYSEVRYFLTRGRTIKAVHPFMTKNSRWSLTSHLQSYRLESGESGNTDAMENESHCINTHTGGPLFTEGEKRSSMWRLWRRPQKNFSLHQIIQTIQYDISSAIVEDKFSHVFASQG